MKGGGASVVSESIPVVTGLSNIDIHIAFANQWAYL